MTQATQKAPQASKYEDVALKVLKAHGFRITMPRVQVVRALADASKALSAYAIHEKIIGGGGKIDVVSVYRILETLKECDLIHHVATTDGYVPRMLSGQVILVVAPDGEVREIDAGDPIQSAILDAAIVAGFTGRVSQLRIEVALS